MAKPVRKQKGKKNNRQTSTNYQKAKEVRNQEYKKRYLSSMLVNLFFAVVIIVFKLHTKFVNNPSEVETAAKVVWRIPIFIAIVYFVTATSVFLMLSDKIYNVVVKLLFSVTLSCCMLALFINTKPEAVPEEAVSEVQGVNYGNIVVWIAVSVAVFLLLILIKNWRRCLQFIQAQYAATEKAVQQNKEKVIQFFRGNIAFSILVNLFFVFLLIVFGPKGIFTSFSPYSIFVFCTLILFGIVLWLLYRQKEFVFKILKKSPFFVVICLFAIAAIIVYGRYLFGIYRYVFSDIGMDSIQQTYPNLLYLADRISSGKWNSQFNFSQGLGTGDGAVELSLYSWVSFFGRENVAYLMGLSQCLKVFLSGVFAYAFSRVYGNGKKVSLIVGMGYAFSAPLIIRGSWTNYPNEALLLMLWLLAYEYAHRYKKMGFLLMASCLFFYDAGTYNRVLWSVLFVAYIIFREILDSKEKIRIREIGKNIIAMVVVIWLICGNLLRSVQGVATTERFTSGKESLEKSIAKGATAKVIFADMVEVTTAMLRTIGTSINGITWDYVGSPNYLEAPAFYCGILLFLLVPVSIYNMEKKKRIGYLLACGAALLYIVVSPLRYMVNGYASYTYKLSSLWIMIFMVLISMEMLQKLFDKQHVKEHSLLIFNFTVEVIILWMCLSVSIGTVSRTKAWNLSFLFILAYTLIINIILKKGASGEGLWRNLEYVLCVCVILEVILISWDSVNDRDVMIAGKDPYNDATVQALEYLEQKDPSWHRTEKTYNTVSLCDSLAQKYYGTKSYVGGTGIGADIVNIYSALELPRGESKYLSGSGGNLYADALWGVKYLLSKEKLAPGYGFELLGKIEDVWIFKNQFALPFAYGYDQVVSKENFKNLSVIERSRIMFNQCVVESGDSSSESISKKKPDGLEKCDYQYEVGQFIITEPHKNDVYFIKATFDKTNLGSVYCSNKDGDVNENSISYLSNSEKEFEIYLKNLNVIWFDAETHACLKDIQIYRQNADDYYADVKKGIEARQKDALQVTSFSDNRIEGYVDYDSDKMLATSIPYSGWRITIDGVEAERQKVNVGFLGVKVPAGKHEIVLEYPSNSWFDSRNHKIYIIALIVAVLWTVGEGLLGRRRGRF